MEQKIKIRDTESVKNIIYGDKSAMDKNLIDSVQVQAESCDENVQRKSLLNYMNIDLRNTSGLRNILDIPSPFSGNESLGGVSIRASQIIGIPIVITGVMLFSKRHNGYVEVASGKKKYGFTAVLMKVQFVIETEYAKTSSTGRPIKVYTFMTSSKQLVTSLLNIRKGDLPVRAIIRESTYKDKEIEKKYLSFSNF